MEIIRVTEEWQRAGVHFVRVEGMCREFDLKLAGEFESDSPNDKYILALDGNLPVSTCRLRYIDSQTGKIERVCTIGSYRNKGIGADVIREAEKWFKENSVKRIVISSREAALNFYIKLGYTPDYTQKSGTGLFQCVMVEKNIGDEDNEGLS